MDIRKIKMDSRSFAYKILYQFEKGGNKIPDIRKLVFSNYPKKNNLKFRTTVLVNEIVRFRGRLDLMIMFISGKKLNFLNKFLHLCLSRRHLDFLIL